MYILSRVSNYVTPTSSQTNANFDQLNFDVYRVHLQPFLHVANQDAVIMVLSRYHKLETNFSSVTQSGVNYPPKQNGFTSWFCYDL